MKNLKNNLIKICFTILLIFSISKVTFCQSEKELLVYIKSEFINFPDLSNQALTIDDTLITSISLYNLLDSFNVLQISRTFPEFSKNDTIKTNAEGISFSVAPFSRIFTLLLSSEEKADSLLNILNDMTNEIVFVEKNKIEIELSSDPDYYKQWYLKNTGQFGQAGADIKIEPVWNGIYIGTTYPIAILDVGVKLNHRDLMNGNHITGDSYWSICPDITHGTRMAGVIGALHNDYDIKGINKVTPMISYAIYDYPTTCNSTNVALIATKVLSASVSCYILSNSYVVKNLSNNEPIWSEAIRLAFQYSTNLGRINVGGMGNNGSYPYSPATFNGVLAIGATDNNDGHPSYSISGPHIDLSAPGGAISGNGQILTLDAVNYTSYDWGTSYSTAMVTGVASIIKNSKNIEREDIEGILKVSADDLGAPGWDQQFGYGRLNAERALNYSKAPYELLRYPINGNIISGGIQGEPYTDINRVNVTGSPNDGLRWLRQYEVLKEINYILPPGHSFVGIWGRGAGNTTSEPITGWAEDFSPFGYSNRYYTPTPFCEVVPGSVTNNSFILRTYIYRFYDRSPYEFGAILLGQYPVLYPSNVSNWQYTILTKNNRIKFATVADYSGPQTIYFENDTLSAFEEFSEFNVRDSTKIVVLDSAILNIPDNYTLRFSGKATSLILNPNSKIIFGENAKLIFDSSATLIANGAKFLSSDSSKNWGGILLNNSGNDSIIGCTFSKAKTAIRLVNSQSSSSTNRVIKNNTFNIPSGIGYYKGIYGENNNNILIQNNTFNMPANSSSESLPYVGIYLKNNLSQGVEAAAEEEGPPITPFNLHLISNIFNNGSAGIILDNYISNLLPYYIKSNTFNSPKTFNLLGRNITGLIKDNNFTSMNTKLGVHLITSSPDMYNNFIGARDVSLHLIGHCYPNLAPTISNGQMIWRGGNNRLSSANMDNIQLGVSGYPNTDWGHNRFTALDSSAYHIYGWVDTSVHQYNSRDNCWYLNGNPRIYLRRNASTPAIPTLTYTTGIDCSVEINPGGWVVDYYGNGIYDSVMTTDDYTTYETSPGDDIFIQAEQYKNTPNYIDAITSYKNLIDNYPDYSKLSAAAQYLYSCYEYLDTNKNLEYRNTLYGNLKIYFAEKLELDAYKGGDFWDVAYDLMLMCMANMGEYDEASNGYEFVSLFHPDPDVRLNASWNFAEIQALIDTTVGGSGGGISSIVNDLNYGNLSEEQIFDLTEMKRIENIIGDDPIMRKMKEKYISDKEKRKERIEKTITEKVKKNFTENARDEEIEKYIKKSSELDLLKENKAKKNVMELKNLNTEQRESRRLEDLVLSTRNFRNEISLKIEEIIIPEDFMLHQNYPNPFNPVTKITYDIPKESFVKIRIYDITGREIKVLVNELKQAGSYKAIFNGSGLSSGVYFYRIEAGDFRQVKRMVMVK